MSQYTKSDLLRIAKRVNNSKRQYLLVNPLQGKHIPVDPDTALKMMRELGIRVKESREGTPLVIAYSETATAIGAAVAGALGKPSFYLQTTRESDDAVKNWIYFDEEHSHATEQKLCADALEERLTSCDYILLVDDEISTGKTILNTVSAIRKAFPVAEKREIIVASIVNRIEERALSYFSAANISFVYLLHPEKEDYEYIVKDLLAREADAPCFGGRTPGQLEIHNLKEHLPLPRRGTLISEYNIACSSIVAEILDKSSVQKNERILVLGTEEFMYPALLLAKELKERLTPNIVRFHATTRSPIGISDERGYPITNGIRIHSMYSPERTTYLYDLDTYDTVIVFTDADKIIPEAIEELQRGLSNWNCTKVVVYYGASYV